MKGLYEFSLCTGLTKEFYYSLIVFWKYICIVLYIERKNTYSRKNANKKGVLGKFTKNMTLSIGWLFCEWASKFLKTKKTGKWQHEFLHHVKVSTHEAITFFNTRFVDTGVFTNASEL